MVNNATFNLTNVVFIAIRAGMEPASTIITAFGGATSVAKIVGIHKTGVYLWRRPKEDGGTDGIIPMHHAIKLNQAAQERGLGIGPASFFPTVQSEGAA